MTNKSLSQPNLEIVQVPIEQLNPAAYNPRRWDTETAEQLKESIRRFGIVDPIIANSAPNRKNVIICGHFRWSMAKELGLTQIPVVFLNIPDIEKEKELNLRLNKNIGEFDWNLLAEFNEKFLTEVGFSSEELDEVFGIDENPEMFDLEKELQKLKIDKIEIQKGEVWQLGNSKLMCGDSTIEADVLKLMNGEKADFCLTDPPYILNYLQGKKKAGNTVTTGFGYKRDRRYL